ncbi:leucyl/phenylalanyl-tRNA--protein transferase [Pseudomonas sp. ABC1]|uniref:leucyl/phenylalanyl-tRNA--protein transferase n=1 Tax=Pseudomonas sp. ABC1 TaxID=2748080 RepID=UPI0015C37D7D|nr:leucyl/phenylalanyl-tRNA--protein transferase [Pseudomonas sp. ABC1]QLF91809.1 leucyl/phenylalanyl-tRNA--protein transferase [Pseudomonas sp. ABC1]
MLTWLSRDYHGFPPLESALREPNGLLAAGGDLSVERLLAAYRHGCFPWYQEGQPLLWWSPNPRMVLFPAELHVSRSLGKSLRRQPFQITFDQDFAAVIGHCAGPRRDADGTWITSPMQQAYLRLHTLGVAHSVEVWQDERLVGGLYGLAMGRLFFGESMFSHVTDASKIGFVHLARRLQAWNFELIDCQMHTRHLASLGAREIPRQAFATALRDYLGKPGESNWQSGTAVS